MDTHEKETTIRQYIAAYNRFDVEEMAGMLHADIVFTNLSKGEVSHQTRGIAAFTELANQSKDIFSYRRQTPVQFKTLEDKTVVTIEFKGILAGDLPNEASQGDEIKLSGSSEFEFEGNKIIRIRDVS